MTSLAALLVVAALAAAAVAPASSLAADVGSPAFGVGFKVANPMAFAREGEPVTAGIPVGRDVALASTEGLGVVDGAGNAVPSQFSVTGRWGGAPSDGGKPVKWLLMTALLDAPAMGEAAYYVVTGAPAPPGEPLSLEETSAALSIDTGDARFAVSKTRGSLIESAVVEDRPVTDSPSNGLTLRTADGATFSSGAAAPDTVAVEEAGPVRATVRVEGSLEDGGGAAPLDYTARLYFYAGHSFTRALITIGNHAEAGFDEEAYRWDVYNYYGLNSVTFSEVSLGLALASPGSPTYLAPTDAGTAGGPVDDVSLYQDSSGTDYWDRYGAADNPRPNSYQTFRGYRLGNGAEEVATGDRSAGWLDLSGAGAGIALGIKDFPENCPKELAASAAGDIRAGLFPARYAGDYNFRVGEEKTHEVVLYFHAGDGAGSHAGDVAAAALDPMWAALPAGHYASSGALGEMTASPGTLQGRLGYDTLGSADDELKYDYYNDRTLVEDPTYQGGYYYPFHSLWLAGGASPSSTEYFNCYGWASYGNQPLEQESYGDGKSGPFDLKYDFDWGAWLQFLRTGEQGWKDLADATMRYQEQLMLHDVVVSMDLYRWRDAVFGHAQHDEPGNVNGQRNYLGPVMDTAWGARGAALSYHLTGYPPARRFCEKFARYAYDFFQDRWEGEYLWNGLDRTYGNLLSVLTAGWEATGDLRYQRMAREVMDYYAPEKQPYIDGPVEGDEHYVRTWMLAMYVNAIGRYARTAGEYGLDEEARVAKERLVAFTDWLLEYGSYEYQGWLTSYYDYFVDGDNTQGEGIMCNWLLEFADACGYAYSFTGDERYLEKGAGFFHSGVSNPFYYRSPLIYSSSKEAVNNAVFGHAYLHFAQGPPSGGLLPVVAGLDPSSAKVGDQVTVRGANFGQERAGSSVSFNGVEASQYGSWADGAVTVTVPPGAKSGPVRLTTEAGTSNAAGFTVVTDEPEPGPEPKPEPGPASAPTWYLAEGSTAWGFETLINIENPNPAAVTALVEYMDSRGGVLRREVALPPSSQTTLNPADVLGSADFSTKVTCVEGKSICVDRRMTWTGEGAAAPEGHSSVGLASPGKTWYLPEGSSDWGFECWVLVQNPGAADAEVTLTYMIEGQGPLEFKKSVPAHSRGSFDMETDVGKRDASVMVSATAPVMAERAMYRNSRREGHGSVGATTATTDYYLAEGSTDWGFTSYVLVQNPGPEPSQVTLTYMTEKGPVPQEPFEMAPGTRKTVRVDESLGAADFSTLVHGSRPVVAERAMYWASGAGEACHDSIGAASPHGTFLLPDGQTGEGFETWTLVQNPEPCAVEVEVEYLGQGGTGNVTFRDTVPAASRRTYAMSDRIPSGRAAVLVTCRTAGRRVLAERAMYWSGRAAGTSTLGGHAD